MLAQSPGVQGHHVGHAGIALRVTWRVGREPQVVAPRLELMVHEDATDRLRGNVLVNARAFQLPRQLAAVPLRQRTAEDIRLLTGELDQVHGHDGRKRLVGDRAEGDLPALAGDVGGSDGPKRLRCDVGHPPGGPCA